MNENPKVFISYSHEDSVFEQKVLEFSNKLRSEGIDANIDLYEESPAEGWPRWIEKQIRTSDFVLVICTESYYKKCLPYTHEGRGVAWEVNIVYQYIYDNYSENTKFIPVYFNQSDVNFIITPLKSFTFYNLDSPDNYDKLYWRLMGMSKVKKPELGELRALPHKEQKAMFFSTPINLDLWNTAKWKGMLYLIYQNQPPFLGILFTNFKAGKEIFSKWKQDYLNHTIDDYLEITYIEAPFPKNNPIYKDPERNFGKGYWVHIGPNLNQTVKRMEKNSLLLTENLLTTLSRYTWMDELNGTRNREYFKELYNNYKSFSLIPVTLKDKNQPVTEENLNFGFEYKITMSNIHFIKGTDVKDDNIYKIVLNYQNMQ